MVHGMFTNLSIYYFNIAPVLAQRFHVVLYDLKGHGMSGRSSQGYDLQTMSDELLELMDKLGLDTVHLAGYSYGGLIALKAAMRFPGRINKLAIIESPNPYEQETMRIADIYSKELLVHFINDHAGDTAVRPGKRQLQRRHRMYEQLLKESSIRQDMQQERDFFSSPQLAGIPHETLLIYGNASDCMFAGQQLHQKISRSQLILVNGDHNIPVQEPFPIAYALKDFFGT